MTDNFDKGPNALKMLIADDDPAIVTILGGRCEKLGFNVETANNGIQLLIKARLSQPDILIVDVNMPDLDGLSVCTRLLNLAGRPIDVVVVTGRSDPETASRCESLGLFYVRKGPDFWKSLDTALVTIYPHIGDKIYKPAVQGMNAAIPRRPRVLVVDDDPSMETFFASKFDKIGVDTLYASDAVHGYRIACRTHPSVIITDNYMPDGDALYFLFKLRNTGATANIPVFVVSGQRLEEFTKQNLKRYIYGRPGAVEVFTKSSDTCELFGALQKYCAFEV